PVERCGGREPAMSGPAVPGFASADPAWHAIAADDVVRRLESDTASGLGPSEVTARHAMYGPNLLPEAARQGPLERVLLQFKNVLVYILVAAGLIKAATGMWVDAAVIFAVVLLNAALGFIQEGRAERALDTIRNMLSPEARTVRGGATRMTPA